MALAVDRGLAGSSSSDQQLGGPAEGSTASVGNGLVERGAELPLPLAHATTRIDVRLRCVCAVTASTVCTRSIAQVSLHTCPPTIPTWPCPLVAVPGWHVASQPFPCSVHTLGMLSLSCTLLPLSLSRSHPRACPHTLCRCGLMTEALLVMRDHCNTLQRCGGDASTAAMHAETLLGHLAAWAAGHSSASAPLLQRLVELPMSPLGALRC